jgi:hypothetical protein
MAQCKNTASKCAKKAPADVKKVKPEAAEKVKGGMNKSEATASYTRRLR